MDWKFRQSGGGNRSTALGRAIVGSADEPETICAGGKAHCGYQDEPSGCREAAPPHPAGEQQRTGDDEPRAQQCEQRRPILLKTSARKYRSRLSLLVLAFICCAMTP